QPPDNHLSGAFGNGSEQILVNTAQRMNEEKNKDQSYFDQETISLVEALKVRI
ncbi:unnamed protein product, partial [Rotaria socialis]